MAKSQNKATTKADVEAVLAEFEGKEAVLEAFCTKTKTLIEASLQDAAIRYQSVQTRVKSKEKLREKYLDPAKNYKRLDDITDLAALRVITYYEDDVDRVAEVVAREFDIDAKNSVDKRVTEPDRFGYSGLNFVGKHLARRLADVEYRKFDGVRCEIQITSILRHAWSEIEHEWYDLKRVYPKKVKRRFYRIAALLELAESEFLDIKKKRTDYERSVAVRVEAEVPDLSLDAVSLRSFIQQNQIVEQLDKSIADLLRLKLVEGELSSSSLELRAKAAKIAGFNQVEDVRVSIETYRDEIVEYVERSSEFWVIGRNASLGKGFCVLVLAMMLAAARGETQAAEAMTALSLSIAFNVNVPAQVSLAQELLGIPSA
jgi:putative GTP pyrophosphokinase